MTAPAAVEHVDQLGTDRPVAVLLSRVGELPPGSVEVVHAAGGRAIVLGDGAEAAAQTLAAEEVWWCDTAVGLRPGRLAARLASVLTSVPLLVLAASADGRDLAPRLAALLDRPLLAYADRVTLDAASGLVHADLTRLDGRLLVPVRAASPAVATLATGRGIAAATPSASPAQTAQLHLPDGPDNVLDVEVLAVLDPEPSTMDLVEASLVVAGGAGLVAGLDDPAARAMFVLLGDVAAALGASAGATRVITDAGWMTFDRQIGTTGVSINPRLYVALGISGATQHTGGLGAPRHVVSVNRDPSCPMTAMATLGLICDAPRLLLELARRLDVEIPEILAEEEA